tara:strand:+ start:173 stop:1081 length:909 start_codon:yes stop_codon:yes gene_type:complete
MIKRPRALITGASGFIGSHLLFDLIDLNFEVLAISRSKGPDLGKNLTWVSEDISSLESLKHKIEAFQPEFVIHLAWQDLPDYSFKASQQNLYNSISLLSYVARLDCCKKIIVSGSCWEYGKESGICKEQDESISLNYFTWAKNSLRDLLEITCKENAVDLVWFRIFYTYGPLQRNTSLIPSILLSLKEKSLPEIKSPYNSNDFIFIEDVVKGFLNSIEHKIPSGIYNLGSGNRSCIADICRIAEKIVLNTDVLTESMLADSKKNHHVMDFWACLEKSKEHLAWVPQVSIEEGIERTWNKLKE